MKPLISVLMPCYNAARYVSAALDSILAQDYPHVEVIVVNDGSTDGSSKILQRYQPRVRVIHQENLGQCAAANRAFRESTGDMIKFFDADDILGVNTLAIQAARLGGRTEAIAFGEWARFTDSSPTDSPFLPLPMYRDADPTDWLATEWMGAQPMMQCALWLIPRPVIERAGPWDERLSLINDFEYFARVLLAANELLFAPGARLYYRSSVAGSLSGQRTRKAVESQSLSLLLGTGHLLAAENSPRTRRACANVMQAFDYEHYPKHADLRARARARAAELGGADIAPSGPPGFHKLRPWIGWKAARHIQHAAEHLGLNGAARRHAAMPLRR